MTPADQELADAMTKFAAEHKDDLMPREPNPPCQVDGCPGPREGQSLVAVHGFIVKSFAARHNAIFNVWICTEHYNDLTDQD